MYLIWVFDVVHGYAYNKVVKKSYHDFFKEFVKPHDDTKKGRR